MRGCAWLSVHRGAGPHILLQRREGQRLVCRRLVLSRAGHHRRYGRISAHYAGVCDLIGPPITVPMSPHLLGLWALPPLTGHTDEEVPCE